MYLSDRYPTLLDMAGVNEATAAAVPPEYVPSADELRGAEMVVVAGELKSADRAQQLAGLLADAVPSGLVVVIAYPARIAGPVGDLVRGLVETNIQDLRETLTQVANSHAAFSEYFATFGRGYTVFPHLADDIEVLAQDAPGATGHPAAICVHRGRGSIYLLPMHNAGAGWDVFFNSLIGSVDQHRAGAAGALPDYLRELRLPGEADLLSNIEHRMTELEERRMEAERLERFRWLIGPLTGAAFETLVLDSLNLVLQDSGYRAEDRPDTGAEDFWIVSPDGDVALAEAKGIATHVRRDHVNQVDNHRMMLDLDVPDLPGLLVVNAFRGHPELERRTLDVNADVVKRARVSNVLILRGIDLYRLVALKVGGEDVAATFVDALLGGGGWLRVTDQGTELVQG